jgi:flagellar hook-associated protein 1 FlgK
MAGGLLSIGTSGLMAAQRALNTTSHNIANVNTEGYSRQRVDQTERIPSFDSGVYVGNGVDTQSVSRLYDKFVDAQVRTSTSAFSETDAYHQMAAQIDKFIADADTSLASPLQDFFASLHDVANDPTSTAARRVMLTDADYLAQRFNTLNGQLDGIRNQVNQEIGSSIDEVNALAGNIATLNNQIVAAYGKSQGSPPNDLLDQRDQLVRQLAEKIDTSTYEDSNGSLSVFVGSGQALVLGGSASQLKLQGSQFDPNQKDIAIVTGNASPQLITGSITSGKIGGLLKFSNEVLNPTQDSLGHIAAGLAIAFNAQHASGTDLNGAAGGNFFTDFTNPANTSGSWFGSSSNTGSAVLSVAFDNTDTNNAANLVASDYRLDFDGGTFTLTRTSDNTQFTSADGSFNVDGLNISVASGSASAKDSFLIRPFRHIAGSIDVSLTDPASIAAAGSPFTGVGDNTNALALAELQKTPTLGGGKSTFEDVYGEIVANVGGRTHTADINNQAQEKLLGQAKEELGRISGVNLDEEAANLLRYQQAYQAAAQVIRVVNSTFDTLIAAVRQ